MDLTTILGSMLGDANGANTSNPSNNGIDAASVIKILADGKGADILTSVLKSVLTGANANNGVQSQGSTDILGSILKSVLTQGGANNGVQSQSGGMSTDVLGSILKSILVNGGASQAGRQSNSNVQAGGGAGDILGSILKQMNNANKNGNSINGMSPSDITDMAGSAADILKSILRK